MRLGFAGAGASSRALIIASVAALLAGSLPSFGSQYAQTAAERDAQQALIADELVELKATPEAQLSIIRRHFEDRGLPPGLAQQVAERLHEHDPLAEQLDNEHGLEEPMSATAPLVDGVVVAAGYALGSALPLMMLLAYPARVEAVAVFVVSVISLAVTSVVISVSAGTPLRRALLRIVGVGAGTMGGWLARRCRRLPDRSCGGAPEDGSTPRGIAGSQGRE